MPETHISPEFERQIRQAMDVPGPDNASYRALRERFISQGAARLKAQAPPLAVPRAMPGAMPRAVPRPRLAFPSLSLAWRLALVILAVLVLLALFSPQVANALRSLFGYIPNVGVVERGAEVLVLAEPVQVERAAVVVIIERAVATNEKTVIVYGHVGAEFDPSGRPQPETAVPDHPGLRLADGTRLEARTGIRQPGEGSAIRYALEFGPLPAKTTTATLELDRLAGLPPGAGPEGWSIPFSFKPGDPSEIFYPVTVYETPTPAPTTPAADQQPPTAADKASPSSASSEPTTQPTPAYGASLTLEKSVELPDGYLLMGSLQWADAAIGQDSILLGMPVITGADGQPVDYEPTQSDSFPQPGEPRQNWAIKIPGKAFAAPLRMEFYVTLRETADARFEFDPGPSPQDGQSWDLNLDVPVNAHPVKIASAGYQQHAPDQHLFLFTMTADQYVIGATTIDPAHPPMGGGGGGVGIPQDNVPFNSGLFVQGQLPEGPMTLQIIALEVLVPGNWVIEWEPGQ